MTERQSFDRELWALEERAPAGYYIGLHIRFATPWFSYATYDPAWMEHYTANAYGMRDPMTAWGFSAVGAKRWSEISKDIPDPFNIMTDAASHGLKYGVHIATGLISSRTICGVSRSDREFSDQEIGEIEALVQHIHKLSEPPESLTVAQVEALRLVAAGHRHTAAAAKLGISESALKARLTSARQRLMARTTAEAIQRAKDAHFL